MMSSDRRQFKCLSVTFQDFCLFSHLSDAQATNKIWTLIISTVVLVQLLTVAVYVAILQSVWFH